MEIMNSPLWRNIMEKMRSSLMLIRLVLWIYLSPQVKHTPLRNNYDLIKNTLDH